MEPIHSSKFEIFCQVCTNTKTFKFQRQVYNFITHLLCHISCCWFCIGHFYMIIFKQLKLFEIVINLILATTKSL